MFFKRGPEHKQPAGYNPPPDDVQRPERPTPALPAKLYDKLGRHNKGPAMKELRYALGQALALIYLLEEGNLPKNIHQIKQEIRAATEGRTATATPSTAIGGYQPTHGELDPSNPPQGGSGVPSEVPPKVLVIRME